jgi:hypothetical protein
MLAANPFFLCTAPTNHKATLWKSWSAPGARPTELVAGSEHVDINIANRHALSTLPRA